MNIAESFATYMATVTGSTIGQDLFIGQAPSSNKVPDSIYWVGASGGDTERKLRTGERMKSYLIEVRYRNRNYETVYEKLQLLEEDLNAGNCTQLSGYTTVDIEATTFPIDEDLDSEDRKVGLLAVTISTYKS